MDSLSHQKTIQDLLSRHGFSFSKALGQNFLINPSVSPRMAEGSGADKETGVIEIGPGIGVLSVELAQRAKKVVCVEIDTRLEPILLETLAPYSNTKVVWGDVLELDLAQLIAENFSDCSQIILCANLPYYITSPIIMRVLEANLPITTLTVMVQKEAADRICAPAGTRAAGAVTIAVRYYSEPKILFSVPRTSFLPAPKVDSAVISLSLGKTSSLSPKEEQLFFACVRAGFNQRRKTMLNSLSAGTALTKAQTEACLSAIGLSSTCRAETLTMENWLDLAKEASSILSLDK